MQKKFTLGQCVRIISIDNKFVCRKYPDIEGHIGEIGRIKSYSTEELGTILSGLKEPLPPQREIEIVYYTIILDKGNQPIKVPHEALEPC